MVRYYEKFSSQLLPLLNIRVIISALIIACLLSACFIAMMLSARPGNLQKPPPTAMLSIIHAPTAVPTSNATATPPVANSGTGVPPSPPPGVIANGATVQVTGTGGEGLRLRSEPGLGNQVLLLASEAEVFRITDGPKEADGYTWWYLVGPFDETRRGWAVSNYLVVVQNP
jgi:hypothetical protein